MAQVRVSTNSTPPDTDTVSETGYGSSGPIQNGTFVQTVMVPNNYYYMLVSYIQGGSGNLVQPDYWIEVEL